MPLSFAIPDLHGRHDLLVAAIAAVTAHAGAAPLTLITLGDYVDKGPDSRQVIEALMALQVAPPPGWDVVCLRGNHDALMRDALRRPETRDAWLAKGGEMALASYDPPGGDGRIPEAHIRWLESLQLMHVDRHRIFVHAGVEAGRPLERHAEQTLLWKRYPDREVGGHGERHVVHGHDRRRDGPKLFGGRTNLDTMAWATGRLVVGVFDEDRPGGPVDLIEVKGPPFPP